MSLEAEVFQDWLDRISTLNRSMLVHPDLRRMTEKKPGLSVRLKGLARRVLGRPVAEYWVTAINAIGAMYAHLALRRDEDLEAIRVMLERHLNADGGWREELTAIDEVMKGYSLLHLFSETGQERYRRAGDELADAVLVRYPKASDGCLLYNPDLETPLVDTLGMACPFLARYAKLSGRPEALRQAVTQITRFVEVNVDPDTRLPYHGYYAGGPYRLGMQGWGGARAGLWSAWSTHFVR
jgi:rhamnogalacturonyl hydrolase YesR